jgi:hypothetical protein
LFQQHAVSRENSGFDKIGFPLKILENAESLGECKIKSLLHAGMAFFRGIAEAFD